MNNKKRRFSSRKLTFKQKIIALRSGKQIYYIPDFGRICLASSKDQCRKKFIKHEVNEANFFLKLLFLFF